MEKRRPTTNIVRVARSIERSKPRETSQISETHRAALLGTMVDDAASDASDASDASEVEVAIEIVADEPPLSRSTGRHVIRREENT